MNSIKPDPYTNELLSKVTVLQPGIAIKSDVYADNLLRLEDEVISIQILPEIIRSEKPAAL